MSSPTPAGLLALQLRPGHPDLLDLPWHLPLNTWERACPRWVEIPRGLSRHEVLFVSYGEVVYALKELPVSVAEREYAALRELEARSLPAVTPVGLAHTRPDGAAEAVGVLVTQYLQGSLPYRTLFMQPGLERYRARLVDALAVLLVRLHLGGCFWGDCSLSNSLFRRDAGELQAYLVDAETSELHPSLSDGQRRFDLDLMEENVAGGLVDLVAAGAASAAALDWRETSASVRRRYEQLWAEITREEVVGAGDSFLVQERIRTLNALGFSVGEVELVATGDGAHLRMRTIVTDRNHHRHLLHNLTGLVAEEHQAQLLLNDVREWKVAATRELNRSLPLSVAAHRWLNERFLSVTQSMQGTSAPEDPCELYCQVLEHKWLMSEREKEDVGFKRAVADYRVLRGLAESDEPVSNERTPKAESS